MTRKFMATLAAGSLFAGGLAVSHLAFAQPGQDGPDGRRGGMLMMADANKDGKVSKAEMTAALDARFASLDHDRDGKLTQQDRELGRKARLDRRFTALDSDRNGQISRAEFDAGHQARADRKDGDGPGGRKGHGMRHRDHDGAGKGMMFRGMGDALGEARKDGVVTRAEFMAPPLAMFDKADANKDGAVSAEEMKAAHQAMRDARQARRGAAKN